MRRLIIFRHAKAERLQPGGSDLSRRLEPRGRSDAEAMGAYLAKHKLVPDFAAVSTSARTRETWIFASAAFTPPPPASFDGANCDSTCCRSFSERQPECSWACLVMRSIQCMKYSASSFDRIGRTQRRPHFHNVSC